MGCKHWNDYARAIMEVVRVYENLPIGFGQSCPYCQLLAELNGAKSSLESILANVEEDSTAFGGKRYAIVAMLHKDIMRINQAIARAEGKE